MEKEQMHVLTSLEYLWRAAVAAQTCRSRPIGGVSFSLSFNLSLSFSPELCLSGRKQAVIGRGSRGEPR